MAKASRVAAQQAKTLEQLSVQVAALAELVTALHAKLDALAAGQGSAAKPKRGGEG